MGRVPVGRVRGRHARSGAVFPARGRGAMLRGMTSRPRALFLPGMMCDERLFALQLQRAPGAPEDALERLCVAFGARDSIEGMASDALALVGDAPAVLVGLSMGGIVAMECLRRRPDLVRALVLMDTNHLAESPERREARVPQIARALAGELDAVLVEEMKPLYLAPANRDDEALLSLVLDMARALGPDVFAAQSRAIARAARLHRRPRGLPEAGAPALRRARHAVPAVPPPRDAGVDAAGGARARARRGAPADARGAARDGPRVRTLPRARGSARFSGMTAGPVSTRGSCLATALDARGRYSWPSAKPVPGPDVRCRRREAPL